MPSLPQPVWLAVSGGLLVVAIVLLVLLLVTARRLRAERREAAEDDRYTARLQVSVADQSGRLRIIRELHDVAVHRVSAMVAQADGARYAGATDPTAAVRAAQTIAETGRETLADMRRVMTLVRESEAEAGPQPRLRSTRELFTTMRNAGLSVLVEEHGEPYDLNAGAELAVYRILQEALSNSLKYGGDGTEVRVAFTWTASGLAVKVDDDGFRNAVLRRGLSADEAAAELSYGVEEDLRSLTQELTGPGIQEMRARTELFGGTLTASETPGVGFSISATFPSIRFHNGVHGVDLSHR
ncbi:sensor histidine kinase [Amnibacterium setariae]|uniref:histidine kinase n=1 Tax=Amnibacterium setariae TaxID=2306585 RepID=A0A3A1U2Q2_9MICO|nr:histidine kinase [Amnibacterium setariae]RIX28137.1 ATP-binding protein [Amnibacterium setariae]